MPQAAVGLCQIAVVETPILDEGRRLARPRRTTLVVCAVPLAAVPDRQKTTLSPPVPDPFHVVKKGAKRPNAVDIVAEVTFRRQTTRTLDKPACHTPQTLDRQE